MKHFFQKYSYCMVKLFITQCVIALFGNVIALAGAKSESNTFTLITSIFSICFYIFLVYVYMWEIGSKDKPAIDGGREKLSLSTGLFIGLGAQIPNYILAIIHAALFPIATRVEGVASTICGISRIVMLFVNGMYSGVMSVIKIGGSSLHGYWWVFFIITIPAVITAMIAYYLGAKDLHFTRLLIPVNPEEQEIKRDKKRETRK